MLSRVFRTINGTTELVSPVLSKILRRSSFISKTFHSLDRLRDSINLCSYLLDVGDVLTIGSDVFNVVRDSLDVTTSNCSTTTTRIAKVTIVFKERTGDSPFKVSGNSIDVVDIQTVSTNMLNVVSNNLYGRSNLLLKIKATLEFVLDAKRLILSIYSNTCMKLGFVLKHLHMLKNSLRPIACTDSSTRGRLSSHSMNPSLIYFRSNTVGNLLNSRFLRRSNISLCLIGNSLSILFMLFCLSSGGLCSLHCYLSAFSVLLVLSVGNNVIIVSSPTNITDLVSVHVNVGEHILNARAFRVFLSNVDELLEVLIHTLIIEFRSTIKDMNGFINRCDSTNEDFRT